MIPIRISSSSIQHLSKGQMTLQTCYYQRHTFSITKRKSGERLSTGTTLPHFSILRICFCKSPILAAFPNVLSRSSFAVGMDSSFNNKNYSYSESVTRYETLLAFARSLVVADITTSPRLVVRYKGGVPAYYNRIISTIRGFAGKLLSVFILEYILSNRIQKI